MKKSITLLALSSIVACGAFAQEQVVDKVKINLTGEKYEIFQSLMIDGIKFVPGNNYIELLSPYLSTGNSQQFNLSDLENISFSFRDSRKMPETIFIKDKCGIADKHNSIDLSWVGIDGASGYQIEISEGGFYGYTPIRTLQVGADKTSCRIENLKFYNPYGFRIKVLSPLGEEFDSQLSPFTNANTTDQTDFSIVTEKRGPIPAIIAAENVGKTDITIKLKLNCSDFTETFEDPKDAYENNFENVDGKFIVTRVRVKAVDAGSVVDYQITDADRAAGKLTITGLQENTEYIISIFNDNISDSNYNYFNSLRVRTKGTIVEPILIPFNLNPNDPTPGAVTYNASSLDSFFFEFLNGSTYAEGQTFYLEGGKNYYINDHVGIDKGIILETNPVDVAAGKRATVFLGGIGNKIDAEGNDTGNPACFNFVLGSQGTYDENISKLEISPIVFRNIDFDCPLARNYGHQVDNIGIASGNYFLNMYSASIPAAFESVEIYNCSFQHFVRGFFRSQGVANSFQINKIVVDGNLFYNCGFYNQKGSGYGWFAGCGREGNNLFNDFSFTNNTIYDSPNSNLISDSNRNLDYNDTKWNIRIEGNTFFNFSTRTSGSYFISTRYVPGDSHFSFKRNLIVLAAEDNDTRSLEQGGADIREIKGSGKITFDIKDNYSIGCREAHGVNDGIFTYGAFSATNRSFGAAALADFNLGTAEDLIVRPVTDESGKVLNATDVFNAPNPPVSNTTVTYQHHKAPEDILNALRYKNLPTVITEKNIGDPRWR